MTAIYPRLPFLRIPGNPSYASDYSSHYVSRQSSLQAEGFNVFNQFKASDVSKDGRLPPIRYHGFGRGSGPPLWAYGTPQLTPHLVQILFGGHMPKVYGQGWHKYKEYLTKLSALNSEPDTTVPIQREIELWCPRNWKKAQINGRRTEQKILDARWRQRQFYEEISLKLGEIRGLAEDVLLKKAGTMERGKAAYLAKMDKTAQKYRQRLKKPQKKPCFTEYSGGNEEGTGTTKNTENVPLPKTLEKPADVKVETSTNDDCDMKNEALASWDVSEPVEDVFKLTSSEVDTPDSTSEGESSPKVTGSQEIVPESQIEMNPGVSDDTSSE